MFLVIDESGSAKKVPWSKKEVLTDCDFNPIAE